MLQMIRGMSVLGSIGFGVVTMTLLLGMQPRRMSKPKQWLFFLGVVAVLLCNFATALALGLAQQGKYYMLLVHLPLGILFWVVTKIHPSKIIFTLFTAVFLIFPANLVSHLIARCTAVPLRYLSVVGFFAALAGLLLLVDKVLKKDFQYLVQHYSSHSFLKLFFLPLVYNMAVYWVGKYNYSISASIDTLTLRGFFFALTFIAYLLVLDIARTDREKQRMKHAQAILSLQLEAANQQMTFLRTTQEQAAIYRHDMRHHFALLSSFAAEANLQKIKAYLFQAARDIDGITPVRYCENEIVNLLLSAFDLKAKQQGLALCPEVVLPSRLGLDDTQLCSLISNALDNAITATAKVPDEALHKVCFCAFIRDGKLLISTENAYVGKIEMEGKLPKSPSQEVGHGFGIKSMVAIVECYGGLYTFETAGEVFILRLMLPLEKKGCDDGRSLDP